MTNKLIAGMANPDTRYDCATQLAEYFGCSYLIVFIKDKEIDALLPAPRFPQTLPIDNQWIEFFIETQKRLFYQSVLPFPDKNSFIKATGIATVNDSVAVLLGGEPDKTKLQMFSDLLPVLTSLFLQEQKTLTAEIKASIAEKAVVKAERLTKTVDGMRQVLKDALIKQEHDKSDIEDLLKKKDDFLNIASHELKTPMTSLKAYMQLLQRDQSAKMPRTIADNALKQLKRLENLINDLLHVSRITNGKLQYRMGPVDFAEVIRETVENIQITFPNHQLIINLNPEAIVNGDQERLEQVLINYITNAVKYSPEASKVVINSEIQDGVLVVSVQDFGIGIEKQYLNNIFDRFYRVDNTAMKYEGMGLGLFIASEIINRHEGNFWIESQIGKGSIFYFKLPLKSAVKSNNITNSANYYSNDFVTIQTNTVLETVEVDWRGYHNIQTIKTGCLKIMEILKECGYRKILNNHTNVLGNWSDASEWVGREWFPLIESAGLSHLAWVYSKVTFSRLAAEKSVEHKAGNVITKFFKTEDDAKKWLNKN